MKRIALLCAVVLLFAAPSWAAERADAPTPSQLVAKEFGFEPNFWKAWGGEMSDGSFVSGRMVRAQHYNGAKVGLVEVGGQEYAVYEWEDGERFIEPVPQEQPCHVRGESPVEGLDVLAVPLPLTEVLAPTTIDVLAMYEPSAADAAGGVNMLHAKFLLGMDLANEIMVNSDLPQVVFRLVGFVDLRYNVPADGWWPSEDVNIRLERDLFQADLVTMVVSDLTGYAGLASFYCDGDPSCGYSIISQGALVAGTLGHELGHNLGLNHNPENVHGGGLTLPGFNRSMSVCQPADQPTTWISGIMSTGSPPECQGWAQRVNRIPGTGLFHNGFPFWIEGVSEQVRVVEMFAPSVANYRESTVTGPCVPDEFTFCLDSSEGSGDGRFRVTVSYNTQLGGGLSGNGRKVPDWETSTAGAFSFFSASNAELLVKIINACGDPQYNRYWFFTGGLTNVGHTVSVTDMVSGIVRTYGRPDLEDANLQKDYFAFLCP